MQQRILKDTLSMVLVMASLASAGELAKQNEKGQWVVTPPEVPAKLKNEVPSAYEEGFVTRSQVCIAKNTNVGKYGNTYFENEKASYPPAMFDVLFGNREQGKAHLQEPDNQSGSWNSITRGIDYYACFTIKHQMRKYFYLGPYLDKDYLKTMYEGAKLWTAEDPTGRHNPYFKKWGDGWTPETKDTWVDTRNTDNLRAMRETSVYLMAEETGSKAVTAQYKRTIQRYVWALWNIGMGEWDSENYHMHTFAPYLNLYDFAKDPEMKATAKAALDMLITMGAVKYYQGGFCGPIKRDYKKPHVFGGAAGELWLYFGDTPIDNPHPHGDTIHMITSAYRPPEAVVRLAQKQLAEPVELFAWKPEYETWKVEGGGSKGRDYPAENYQDAPHKPWIMETTFIGDTFQLGTLPLGSFGDLNGFKLLMRDSKKGAQFFVPASVDDPAKAVTGSGKDRVAHCRNLAIALAAGGDSPWAFVIPDGAAVETEKGITFLKTEATWIALSPISLAIEAPDGTTVGKKGKGWANTQGMRAKGKGGAHCGFALEVGDARSYGDYSKFKKMVMDKAKLDISGLADGKVTYTGANGVSVGIEYATGEPLPKVIRNGEPMDFGEAGWALWKPTDGGKAPVSLGWKQGVLHVEAGGATFDASLSRDGAYTFDSKF